MRSKIVIVSLESKSRKEQLRAEEAIGYFMALLLSPDDVALDDSIAMTNLEPLAESNFLRMVEYQTPADPESTGGARG